MGVVRIITLLAAVPSCHAFFVTDKLQLQEEPNGLPLPGLGTMIRRALQAANENKTLIEKSKQAACPKHHKVAKITWRAVTNKRGNCLTITLGDHKTQIRSCRRRGQRIYLNLDDMIQGETRTQVKFAENMGSGAFMRVTGDIESGPFVHVHDEISCAFCGKPCFYPDIHADEHEGQGNGLLKKVLGKCPITEYEETDHIVPQSDAGLIEALPEKFTKFYFTFAAFKNKNEKVSKMFAMVVTVSVHCPEHDDSIPAVKPGSYEVTHEPETFHPSIGKKKATNNEHADDADEDGAEEMTNPEIEELLASNENEEVPTDDETDEEVPTN